MTADYDYFYGYSDYLYGDNYEYYYDNVYAQPFSKFCGDSTWMNETLGTWRLPFFSWCFQHTVIAQIPVLYFFVSLPFLWLRYRVDGAALGTLPYNSLASMKYALTLILAGVKLALLFRFGYQRIFRAENVPIVEFVDPLLNLLTLACLITVLLQCRRYGIVSPGSLFGVWLLFVACGLPEFIVWLLIGTNPRTVNSVDFYRYLAYLIWYPICCVQLILCFLPEKIVNNSRTNAVVSGIEYRAAFVGRHALTWFTALTTAAKRRALSVFDIFHCLPSDAQAQELLRAWNAELTRQEQKNERAQEIFTVRRRRSTTRISRAANRDDKTPLISQQKKQQYSQQQYGSVENEKICANKQPRGAQSTAVHRRPSIIWLLIKMNKWQLLQCGIFKILTDLAQFLGPLLLMQLLAFVEDDAQPLWRGCAIAVAMFAAALLSLLFRNIYRVGVCRVRVRVHSALFAAIYDKTLRLYSNSCFATNKAQLLSLMTECVKNFEQTSAFFITIFAILPQTAIGIFLLSRLIGAAAFAMLIFLLFLTYSNIQLRRYYRNSFIIAKQNAALRLELTRRLLSNTTSAEMLALQPTLLGVIQKARSKEIRELKRAKFCQNFRLILNMSATFLATFVTLFLYAMINTVERQLFTSTVIFVSRFLILVLEKPFIAVAKMCDELKALTRSNAKLKRFFAEEEVDGGAVAVRRIMDATCQRAIDIQLATFDWTRQEVYNDAGNSWQERGVAPRTYALCDVELHVKRGILVVVAGAEAASTLLYAVMGEMRKLYGDVDVRGRLAYCPRATWTLSDADIRTNITLHTFDDEYKFDALHYATVVEACGLKELIENQPQKDFTPISALSATSSSSEWRAKISSAQAAYQLADTYLFEDVLSTVAPATASQLFQRVIGPSSILAGATRLLVSNTTQHAQVADLLIVVRENKIKFVGTYGELGADNATIFQQIDEKTCLDKRPEVCANVEKACDDFQLVADIAERQHETVLLPMFSDYVHASRHHTFTIGAIFLFGSAAFAILNQYWLSDWANPDVNLFISDRFVVYFIIGVFVVLSLSVALFSINFGTVRASSRIFNDFMNALVGALHVVDAQLLPRLVYSFSKDVERVDWMVGRNFQLLVVNGSIIVFLLAVFFVRMPILILPNIIVLVVALSITLSFVNTVTQLRKLKTIALDSLLIRVENTIVGLRSIRAYGISSKFAQNFNRLVDEYCASRFCALMALRWLRVRVDFLGAVFILTIALFCAICPADTLPAPFVGLFVLISFQMSDALSDFARKLARFESEVPSVSRIKSLISELRKRSDRSECATEIPSSSAQSIRRDRLAQP